MIPCKQHTRLSVIRVSCERLFVQYHKMRRSFRALGINLLLCAASVSIFFGGAEVLARLKYTPQKNQPHPNSMFDYDKEKIFGLKKSFSGMFKDLPFTTNSFGHRSPEIAVEKPEGTKRVLVLGDSVMFGHRLLDHETSSHFLEQSLNGHYAELGEGSSVEVINTAAPGNATYQEYYDLERGLKFDPDVIVLQFTLNDVIEHNTFWLFRDIGVEVTNKENEGSYLFGHDDMSYTDNMLKQNSAFYLFLKDMYGRMRFKDVTGENIVEKAEQEQLFTTIKMIDEPEHPRVKKEWDNCLTWMRKITTLAKEKGIPLILVATPLDFQLGWESRLAYPQHILRNFAEEEEIQFVDLLETLQKMYAESAEEEPVETKEEIDRIIRETDMSTSDPFAEFWAIYFLEYIHPSVKGNELIVSILEPFVLKELQSSAE